MNPLVQKNIEALSDRIEELARVLAQAQARTERAERQRQETLETQLQQRKQLVTLQHKADAFDELQRENARLTEMRTTLHERLRKLLAFTKALAAEIRQ